MQIKFNGFNVCMLVCMCVLSEHGSAAPSQLPGLEARGGPCAGMRVNVPLCRIIFVPLKLRKEGRPWRMRSSCHICTHMHTPAEAHTPLQ